MLGVTPSAARPLCGRAAASCAVERSIFAVSLAFYHKATPSVSLRSTAPPNPPQKNTTSFFGDPGGGAKEIDVCRASKITEPSRVSLRLVAAEQISQAASFLAALLRCSLLLFPQNSLRDFCGNPVLLNFFREQNHAFALRDSICPMLRAYCLIRTKRGVGDNVC